MFVTLRQDLVVVTGSIYTDGGEKSTRRDRTRKGPDFDTVEVTQSRVVSKGRREAATITASYHKRFKKFRLLRTPFGSIYEQSALLKLKDLILAVTKTAVEFNAKVDDCRMYNCLLWEPLVGNRQASLEGYLARRAAEGDPEVTAALKLLSLPPLAMIG